MRSRPVSIPGVMLYSLIVLAVTACSEPRGDSEKFPDGARAASGERARAAQKPASSETSGGARPASVPARATRDRSLIGTRSRMAPDSLADTAAVTDPTMHGVSAPSEGTAQVASGGVAIYPGQDIQAAVDSSPPGTVFLLKAGVHRQQSVIPKPGNAFIGEKGAVLDGENVAEYAFHRGRPPYPRDVRIQGLSIHRYSSRPQMGAITAGGRKPLDLTTGWVVEDCEIQYNASAGVRLGHKMRVLRNRIHHNGQIGVVGTGDSILVEGNEIAYNNYESRFRMGWEAGGAKFARTRWLVVRDNYVHDNRGNGLWTDIHNIHTLYEGNRVEDNAAQGIFHEISYDAVIRNNTVARNGFGRNARWLWGAGILIAASSNVEVYGNTVTDNFNGIAGIQQNRGSGPYGPHELWNLDVHDNTITMSTGRSGIVQDVGDDAVFTSRNNRFRDNTYHLGLNAKPFAWMNGVRTGAQWQAFGLDAASALQR